MLMSKKLLLLLQLCNSSLPLGAYSYSEGLETLVEDQHLTDDKSLKNWLLNELKYGSIRIESAIVVRAYQCYLIRDLNGLLYWNNWFTASRETAELRQQSWQMGKSLLKLISSFDSEDEFLQEVINSLKLSGNYSIAFGIITAHWNIKIEDVLLGYLHNWISNLVNVGIKLIPLGQTQGQKLLLSLNEEISKQFESILSLKDEELSSCSWGLSLASIKHEQLYTRLFRS
ncbi:urease accessory protein UreF [Geminocystis sp. NIES-3709]|uniref:urease accessory protein UreF n=1 Tax=Geminocystis sp. NIES-3709 TaxID=1617448 RepID=UPI0005FC4F1F|nr:urease accessory protein UreF [Geminocystis sp. NIES-3709]BAQ63514.1 urease accessory protein UreF [Geminocystis sp. NIES-3709]